MINKRIKAGEDPYPITYCQRVPSQVYETEKTLGVQTAMLDLLQQIVFSVKLTGREKKKKLKKFKEAYPEIYRARFPSEDDEPEFMQSSIARKKNSSALSKLSSLTRLKNAIRI